MKDDVLNKYIQRILAEDIEEKNFEKHIDMFSRFLGYINADYKYNGTYLHQYICDFMQLYQMLKKKNVKYNEIANALAVLGINFELLADQSFEALFSPKAPMECAYVGINKNAITSDRLGVRIKIVLENKEYVYCKVYDNFLYAGFTEKIINDVKEYMKMKETGRVDDEAS